MTDNQYLETVKLIGIAVFGIALMALILSTFVSGLGGISGTGVGGAELTTENLNIISGDATLRHHVDSGFSARQSLETQLETTGASNSHATAEPDVSITANATFCAFTETTNTSQNATIATYNGDYRLQYHNTTSGDQWVGLYWDAGDRQFYDVNVSVTTPSTRTLLCLQTDGDTLRLSRNGTAANDTASLDGTHTLDHGDPNYGNYEGRIDELRLYNVSVTGTHRDEIQANPSAPLGSPRPVARTMFDARDRSTTSVPVYFTGDSATLSNASLVDGVPGQPLRAAQDYRRDDRQFTVLSGGRLDGAPVAFVSYEPLGGAFAGILPTLFTIGPVALGLLVIGLLVIASRTVMDEFGGGF